MLPACRKKPPPAPEPEATSAAVPPEPAAPAPRCALALSESVLLGEAAAKGTAPGGATLNDDLLPFAAEVGDAVAWSGGFAVGAVYEKDGSPVISVVTLGPDGRGAQVVELGSAHSDVEPPRLAARGGLLIAAVLEPEPNGRLLRLAKIEDTKVNWGASLREPSDESQAFDLAIGDKKGVVVWDEDGPAGGVIRMAAFEPLNPATVTAPHTVSPARSDAESPRLVTRAGGYWLGYIARRSDPQDAEARFQAEDIGYRWIEVVPLDDNGFPTATARPVTSKDGHVMVFDMAPESDGALLVWRDDNLPSGASGGQVMRAVVHPSGIDPPTLLADDGVGVGVPSLVGTWLAVADAAESTRLAPVSPAGVLAGPLLAEPDIGTGEPIAAVGDTLLVARPTSRAVRLLVLRCRADAPLPPDARADVATPTVARSTDAATAADPAR